LANDVLFFLTTLNVNKSQLHCGAILLARLLHREEARQGEEAGK
jgi:hypothetical protein